MKINTFSAVYRLNAREVGVASIYTVLIMALYKQRVTFYGQMHYANIFVCGCVDIYLYRATTMK